MSLFCLLPNARGNCFRLFFHGLRGVYGLFVALSFRVPRLRDYALSFKGLVSRAIGRLCLFILHRPIVEHRYVERLPRFENRLRVLHFRLLTTIGYRIADGNRTVYLSKFGLQPFVPLIPCPSRHVLRRVLHFDAVRHGAGHRPMRLIFRKRGVISRASLSRYSMVVANRLRWDCARPPIFFRLFFSCNSASFVGN